MDSAMKEMEYYSAHTAHTRASAHTDTEKAYYSRFLCSERATIDHVCWLHATDAATVFNSTKWTRLWCYGKSV